MNTEGPGSESPAGDVFDVKSQGNDNVIAVGDGAAAAASGGAAATSGGVAAAGEDSVAVAPGAIANILKIILNIKIGDVKWQPVVIVMVIVGGLLAAILYFVVPKPPSVMTGGFNVAVAEFLVTNKDGGVLRGEDGKLLAGFVASQIETQMKQIELSKTTSYQIWGPDRVKPVLGEPSEVAEKIKARLLIYGVIVTDGDRSKLTLSFYINHQDFAQASEINGVHAMGSEMRVTLPIKGSIPLIENQALAGRVNALDLITIGLAYYSVDNYPAAASYFEKAVAEERWLRSSGKELGYLLLGNAYAGWAGKDNDNQYLAQAAENYAEAIKINPKYGRGLIGEANIKFLEALGPLQDPKIDPVKLDEAEVLAKNALALPGQPESAYIPIKAHLNLGQINMARYRANIPGQDWLELARKEFEFITETYEHSTPAVETYAAHAYYRLAIIEYTQNKTDQAIVNAIDLVKKAIKYAPPFYKGEYSLLLANIYQNSGDHARAVEACEDAIAYAAAMGDGKSVEKYEALLAALK